MRVSQLLIAGFLLQIVASQSSTESTSGRVAGIGVGTFLIILSIIFSIAWCLACRSSSRPEIYSIIGIIIPGLLILLFIVIPKEKDRVPVSKDTDMNYVTHIVFLVLAMIAFLIAGLSVTVDYLFTDKKAKNIARSAFIIKEEEEDILADRRSRAMGSRQGSQPHLRPVSNQSNI